MSLERRCDTFCQPETLKISHCTGVRNVDSKVKRRSCIQPREQESHHRHDGGKSRSRSDPPHPQLMRNVPPTAIQCSNDFTAAYGGVWTLTWLPIEAKIPTLSRVPMPRPLTPTRAQLPILTADAHLSRTQTPEAPSISLEHAATMDAMPFNRSTIRLPQKARTSPSAAQSSAS